MAVQEYQFCRKKGDRIALPLSPELMYKIITKRRALDAVVVFKECVDGKSSAWLFNIDITAIHPAKVIPLQKKLSEHTIQLMVEGYQESADEDLVIAKEFAEVENELDDKCDTEG